MKELYFRKMLKNQIETREAVEEDALYCRGPDPDVNRKIVWLVTRMFQHIVAVIRH